MLLVEHERQVLHGALPDPERLNVFPTMHGTWHTASAFLVQAVLVLLVEHVLQCLQLLFADSVENIPLMHGRHATPPPKLVSHENVPLPQGVLVADPSQLWPRGHNWQE